MYTTAVGGAEQRGGEKIPKRVLGLEVPTSGVVYTSAAGLLAILVAGGVILNKKRKNEQNPNKHRQ